MSSLTLYTTLGCHLCEHAETLLEAAGCHFVSSDIAEDLTLLERYGTRIPVVRDSRAGNWDGHLMAQCYLNLSIKTASY